MNVHQNARTTPWSRAQIVHRVRLGESVAAVTAAFHVTPKTVRRLVKRATAGEPLPDRSCRPHASPTATRPEVLAHIERLRGQRWPSAAIAATLQLGRSPVARLVARLGLARLRALEPAPPVQR